MKKQTKIILGILLVLVIGIIILSLITPPVIDGLSWGTFGKADKFRKSQMTEKDVKLRSEFTSDTAQLKNNIKGLVYFSAFTHDLSGKIDSCVMILNKQGFTDKQTGYNNIKVLKEYSDFIKNNNKTLENTIIMLAGFCDKTKSDQSADVEKNLRDFGNYVKNLNERDSILDVAIKSMDKFMLTDKALRNRKPELLKLKSIRDQLLIKSIQTAGLLKDKQLCSSLLYNALNSQTSFGKIIVQAQELGTKYSNQGDLKMIKQIELSQVIYNGQISFGSAQQLGEIFQSQQVNNAVNSQGTMSAVCGKIILYDQSTLSYVVGNKYELQKVLSSAQLESVAHNLNIEIVEAAGTVQAIGIGVIYTGVAVFSSQGLNLYESKYDLSSAYGMSQELSNALNSAGLNMIHSSQENFGSFEYSGAFMGFLGELGNLDLGSAAVR